jgi:hypothetical protein
MPTGGPVAEQFPFRKQRVRQYEMLREGFARSARRAMIQIKPRKISHRTTPWHVRASEADRIDLDQSSSPVTVVA